MTLFTIRRAYYIVLILVLLPSTALAERSLQEVDAITDKIQQRVYALHEANFSEPQPVLAESHDYQPRHVYQLMRSAHKKIQTLKRMNNMEAESLEPFPIKQIDYDDVYLLSQKVYEDIDQLLEIYQVYRIQDETEDTETQITLEALYHKAANIDSMISQLGLTPLFYKEIYLQGALVKAHLKDVVKRVKEGEHSTFSSTHHEDITTQDLYEELYKTARNFKSETTKKRALEITGGVLVEDKVRFPGADDVIKLFLMMEADVIAVKAHMDLSPLQSPPTLEMGKIPSDVDSLIQEIQHLLKQL